MNPPLLIVLTGKTASGKDTIKSALLRKYPNLKKVITTTSRVPRTGEKDGVDYHFLKREQFEDRIRENAFAEYVEYGGNFYGTAKIELEQALESDTLWKIDPSRAGEVRDFINRSYTGEKAQQLIKRVLVIYINTSDDVVLERLKRRSLSNLEIQKRMSDDTKIWQQYKDKYDFVIENISGQLDQTIHKVCNIIDRSKI